MLISNVHYRRQRGVTLIESLMALVIISIALLGVASLQLLALQDMRDARWRASAVNLAGSMLEQLRVDREEADEYSISVENSAISTCEGTTVATCDALESWLGEVSASLPSSLVNLSTSESIDEETSVSLSIRWRQSPAGEDDPIPACGQDAESGGCIRLVTFL